MKPSPAQLLSELVETTCKNGASAADAVWFDTVDVSVSYRKGRQEGLERSESSAIGLRAFVGSSQAVISSTDLSPKALKLLSEKVIAMAGATPPDTDSSLAERQLMASSIPDLDLCDGQEPSTEWLAEECLKAESVALATKGITNSEGADAGYSRSNIALATAEGGRVIFSGSYPSSHFSLSVSVLAGEGTNMERDYDFTSARHRANLKDANAIGKEAAARALKRLNPKKIATCKLPVLFDKRVSRSLLNVFAGCISGSAVARGASFLKDDMDKQVFAQGISIIDNPHMKRALGSKPFDGEGVATHTREMVKDGILQSWLLDTRTGKKLGLQTTGHATRGIASPPSPSPSNFYLAAGSKSPAALLKDMGTGLVITETFGMGINSVTGDYSQGASGFYVENGEIAYPVSGITIAGNLRDMFAHAIPANDLEFIYGTNCPSLLINNMTIAGT